jgi:D-serine deaminase-like pyridoxal phosphate-dependent protein
MSKALQPKVAASSGNQVGKLGKFPPILAATEIRDLSSLGSSQIARVSSLLLYSQTLSMMNLNTLKTPCLILDLERVKRNAARINDRVRALGVGLRPHIKTHKSIEVARIQTEGHSRAITVSTLAEATAFAAHGFRDITYAVPIETGKIMEAIELSKKCERLALITDDFDIPIQLNDSALKEGVKLDVFLKVDCGYHRCGVEPCSKEAFEIPRRITDSSNLRFAGILTHAGHSYHARPGADLLKVARHERDLMLDLAAQLRTEGIEVPTISIGSTPTFIHVDHLTGIDEVRAGNYIFFDAFQATLGSCKPTDCALTVLASVVHRDRCHRKVVIDAGAIALSKDRGAVEFDPDSGYGRVQDLDGTDLGLRVHSLSQEHGICKGVDDQLLEQLKVGTRVRILANHSCLTASQHSLYHVLQGNQIVDRWAIERGW